MIKVRVNDDSYHGKVIRGTNMKSDTTMKNLIIDYSTKHQSLNTQALVF